MFCERWCTVGRANSAGVVSVCLRRHRDSSLAEWVTSSQSAVRIRLTSLNYSKSLPVVAEPDVLVCGTGVAGNAIDRIRLGYVQDWLVIGPSRWNIADLYLLVAIPLTVWLLATRIQRKEATP